MAAPSDPTLAVGDLIEIVHIAEEVNDYMAIINRMYWLVTNVPATPVLTLGGLVGLARTTWVTNMLPNLSVDYYYYETRGYRVSGVSLSPPTGPRARPVWDYDRNYVIVGNNLGATAGARFPAYVTTSIRFRTGFLGRNWRGGIRIGIIPISAQHATDNDEINATYRTAMGTAINAVLANMVSLGTTAVPVIASARYFYDVILPVSGAPSLATAQITSSDVNNFLRTQDSRKAPFVP